MMAATPLNSYGRSRIMTERSNPEWREALIGPAADTAIEDLRAILLRGLRYALASRRIAETDLEDFVHDALLRILQELPSFRGDARFTTWAQKVCVRVALTELRRRRWRDVSLEEVVTSGEQADFTPEVLTDKGLTPGQIVTTQIMMATIQRIIAEELTERQRLALVAVMQGGMPLQEVAERMGTNRNALYKLLHDARQRLQKRMMHEGLSPQELLAMFDEA
jgi:RNA polymerase sigma-70 factor (ECF subfamily)